MTEALKDIPVTLVTGMLGAGKTTLIEYLLDHRPPGQRWAVLVNEFSENGVDGRRLAREGVAVREVVGGCMGCTAAVTLRVELNRLLRQARPERLLIEPTGLGHPQELLALLSGEYYRDVLALRATLCLLDARRLAEQKFSESSLWRQQLDSADILLGSKADLWNPEDRARYEELCAVRPGLTRGIVPAGGGTFDPQWLDTPAGYEAGANAAHPHHHGAQSRSECLAFAPHVQFDPDVVRTVLTGLQWERVKGTLRTAEGAVRIDGTAGEVKVGKEPGLADNRLVLIGHVEQEREVLEQRMLVAALPM